MSDKNPGRDRKRKGDRLDDLDRRIAVARDAHTPKPSAEKEKYAAFSMGWRMVIELAVSLMVGAAMGWGLDTLLGTLPMFLIVFCMLGFASGVRSMMRTAEELQRKQVAKAADDERA